VASPDGPTLLRDPRRAEDDAREVNENQNLNVASNRLGGQDLRVFRDNVATMTFNPLNENGKRSAGDGAATTTSFAKGKRVRARKRIDEIQREIDEAERRQSSAGGDLMRMMLVLQKDSDRRAEAEETRRRADRDERFEVERRERAEREQIRHDEAEAVPTGSSSRCP
jgi:cytochrome P450